MNAMRIFPLLGVALCALPLLAQAPARRVVVPCELTTASLSLTGNDSPEQGREFSLHVINNSALPVSMPRTPEFGWRVKTGVKSGWKLKAEGGPVRRMSHDSTNPHLAVTAQAVSGPMVEILPGKFQDFIFYLPQADAALSPGAEFLTTLTLDVYWAASAAMAQSNPGVPGCAVAAHWMIAMQQPQPAAVAP